MRKLSLLYLSMLLALISFASCDNDEGNASADQSVLATFRDVGVQTRAVGATWEDGDRIGIFCVAPDKTLGTGNFADNKCYRYNASLQKFQPETAADEIYFGRNQGFSFYAYYPYRSDITNPTSFTHSVGTSQKALADHRKADLVTGRSAEVNIDGTVMMDFFHAMTMVELDWSAKNTPTAVKTIGALFPNTAVVNLASPVGAQVTTTGSKTEIAMYRESGDDNKAHYVAFIPTTSVAPDQEIFLPRNAGGDKTSDGLRYSGSNTVTLESGKKYNLSATLFEVTATVADGAFENGFSGGMFFRGRECTLKVNRTDNTNAGCKFVGFYEVADDGKLALISDPGISSSDAHAEYKFTVDANRRIKAVFTHEYSDWVANNVEPVPSGSVPGNITVTNQGGGSVSPDGIMRADGKNVTIRPEGGVFTVTASAMREVRLNGTVINHEYADNLTIRNNSSVGGFTWSPPSFSATANTDLDASGGIKGERRTTMTVVGPDGKDITAANGGVINVNQLAGAWVNNWSISYTLTGSPIAASGGTATVTCYAVNKRSLAGVTDNKFTVYAAPSSSSSNSTFTKSAITANGATNWKFTVSAPNNTTESARSTSITLSHESATVNFDISQAKGSITSYTYGPWKTSSVTGSVSPSTVAASGGNFTYSAVAKQVRDKTPVWNGVAGSGTTIANGDSQTINVSASWTKVDGAATINSNGTGSYGNNESGSARTSNAKATYGGVSSPNVPVYQSAGNKVYSKPVITFKGDEGTNIDDALSSSANEKCILTYSVSVSYQWNGSGTSYSETYYPTISGSATGFVRTETAQGKSSVITEANYGDARSVTYTATFSISGQTANPVSVTIYQKRAWNVDT